MTPELPSGGAPGTPVCCNICGSTAFITGPNERLSRTGILPRCAQCRSLERHRLMRKAWLLYPPEALGSLRALQFSHDPTVDRRWFGEWELSVYGERNSLDLEHIDRPDGRYDMVICNHVLEHIRDDRLAFRELIRILSHDGVLQFSVPNPYDRDVTEEWGFPKPEQHDHYRLYGRDLVQRFTASMPDLVMHRVESRDEVTGVGDYMYFAGRQPAIQRVAQRIPASI
jgi:SAM-dependent methyltransferase